MRALSTAATGMEAQSLAVEVISHNLANMNTVAFKRQRAEFDDLLYQTISQPGANSSDAGTIVPLPWSFASKAGRRCCASAIAVGATSTP